MIEPHGIAATPAHRGPNDSTWSTRWTEFARETADATLACIMLLYPPEDHR
jgi:hypothetical protein